MHNSKKAPNVEPALNYISLQLSVAEQKEYTLQRKKSCIFAGIFASTLLLAGYTSTPYFPTHLDTALQSIQRAPDSFSRGIEETVQVVQTRYSDVACRVYASC